MGQIAAGVPISAIENYSHDIPCPPYLLGNGEYYALEVRGDSMVDAGIHDHDTVIIKRCNFADNGSIVVALIEDEQATLKRLRKRGNIIELEAANPKFETQSFDANKVRLQGCVVGLIRRY
ncbi:MAG: LexA repressor [Hyphomicrobiaceae bacterium hypho_1]